MGLQKTNYTIKSTGITIPTAYAMVKALEINGTRGRAVITVQQTREANASLRPLEVVSVDFTINRSESPFVTAYAALKADKKARVRNEETKRVEEVMIRSPFAEWEDDIQPNI